MYNTYSSIANVYDKYIDQGHSKKYVDFLVSQIQKDTFTEVKHLDFACGTGELIKELRHQLGSRLTLSHGCDRSSQMLSLARKKNKQSIFFETNMLHFSSRQKYNVISCVYDSINYLDQGELKKFVTLARSLLTRNGLFFFDFNTIYKMSRNISQSNNFLVTGTRLKKEYVFHLKIKENSKYIEETHKQHLYSFSEVQHIIRQSGFKRIQVFNSKFEPLQNVKYIERLYIKVQA